MCVYVYIDYRGYHYHHPVLLFSNNNSTIKWYHMIGSKTWSNNQSPLERLLTNNTILPAIKSQFVSLSLAHGVCPKKWIWFYTYYYYYYYCYYYFYYHYYILYNFNYIYTLWILIDLIVDGEVGVSSGTHVWENAIFIGIQTAGWTYIEQLLGWWPFRVWKWGNFAHCVACFMRKVMVDLFSGGPEYTVQSQ